jgi:hypothetical protein
MAFRIASHLLRCQLDEDCAHQIRAPYPTGPATNVHLDIFGPAECLRTAGHFDRSAPWSSREVRALPDVVRRQDVDHNLV